MNRYIFIILLLLLGIACQNDQNYNKLLVGHWQLVNFTTNQKIQDTVAYQNMARQMILTTSIIFNPDHTVESYIWGSRQKGSWKVSGQKLVIYSSRNKKNKFEAKIVKLDKEQLVLYYQKGKLKVMLYFKNNLLN